MTGKRGVVAGVDTHKDTHHVAVVSLTGQVLGDRQFTTSEAGYQLAWEYMASFGPLERVGVEGTNSYGAGLSRFLRTQGVEVREVIRPKRSVRRLHGKSDPIDALQAAQAVLADKNLPTPKTSDAMVESIRIVHAVRHSAVKARTAAMTQLKSLLVTAPQPIRDQLRHLPDDELITHLSRDRPGRVTQCVTTTTWRTLHALARRYDELSTEINELTRDLEALVRAVNPALLAAYGFGPVTSAQLLITTGDNFERLTSEAAFASLCGTAPLPASSGKTTRHRLNRGGDRRANCALHTIALARLANDPRTKAYAKRLKESGKSPKDILRCLKRAIAREAYHLLTAPPPIPTITDLRPLRTRQHITLEQAAKHLSVWPSRLSRIERGMARDDTLTTQYRQWLHDQAKHNKTTT